jgi:hypothetical protein
LLDNQVDISIMHPMLLRDVQKAQSRIRVKIGWRSTADC